MRLKVWLSVLLAIGMVACDDSGDDNGGPGNGGGGDSISGDRYGKIQILSSDKHKDTAPEVTLGDCNVIMDIYSAPNSSCLTPLSVSGYAGQIDLQSSEVGGVGPRRIMSQAEEDQAEGTLFPGAPFTMAAAASNFVGNNTLFEEYSYKRKFDGVSLEFAYVTYKVQVKDKYVTVLLPSYDQPFADQAKSLCGFDDTIASQARYTNMDLLTGMTFKRGDYLFCVKDSESAACSAGDYQWLNTSNNSLESTRPSAPRQSSYLANNAITCTNEGDGRYNFNFGPTQIWAKIEVADQFKLYGDFSNGELSNQWPGMGSPFGENENDPDATAGDPYMLYTYEHNGTSTEGTELVIQLDFDGTDSVFVDGMNTSAVSSASIGAVLAKLEMKSQWVYDKKSDGGVVGGNTSHYAGMTVTPTVTLTGERNRPRAKEEL